VFWVLGFGFAVWVIGVLGIEYWDLGLGVLGFGFWIMSFGFWVLGFWLWVRGWGFEILVLKFERFKFGG
jgi:hypothetical protein